MISVVMSASSAKPATNERLPDFAQLHIEARQDLPHHGITRRQHAIGQEAGRAVQIAKLVAGSPPFHLAGARPQPEQIFSCGPDRDSQLRIVEQHIAILELHSPGQGDAHAAPPQCDGRKVGACTFLGRQLKQVHIPCVASTFQAAMNVRNNVGNDSRSGVHHNLT